MADAKPFHRTTPKLKTKSKTPSKTPESKFWASFKTHQIPDLISSVTSIAFNPAQPHDFAATFSASLSIFSSKELTLKHTISSPFKDVAYSASYRCDGLLLAASCQSGNIHVLSSAKRTQLRLLKGHTRPVRLAKYPVIDDKVHLFSGGDDALVKYWDVVSESQVLEFRGHKDYVRCGDGSPVSADMFVTGSYDHTVRLWDVRVPNLDSVLEVNHGKPVEDVIFLPSGGLVATAGGNVVKIWDVIGGGKLVHTMESHNKTVTSLCVGKVGRDLGEESDQFRVLSVSLDGYMKVFDYSKSKVTHSMRFPAPLLSIALSPDCKTRAIGTSNGIIYAGKRKVKDDVDSGNVGELVGLGSIEEPHRRVLKPSYFRYFHRGQSGKPSENDYIIMKPKKVKLAEHDRLLKKFRHKEALVSVLSRKDTEQVVAVMEELVARKKLLKCVSNLDIEELGLLLEFLYKNCSKPRYSSLLMGLTNEVLQLRMEEICASEILKAHVRNLKSSVEEEIRIQQAMQEIQGIISPLLRIAGRR
uniref:U3 small nucleolar RNA-associated protein 15 C-terminal domain-containing protein n=1 Tax=Kalanchoe fedtschenkoi TaxID=63787 RepID=A0A7N0SYN3_KALFE